MSQMDNYLDLHPARTLGVESLWPAPQGLEMFADVTKGFEVMQPYFFRNSSCIAFKSSVSFFSSAS